MKIKSNKVYLLSKCHKKEEQEEVEETYLKRIKRSFNHIYFYSEVDRDTIFELIMLIKEAEEENIITSYKLNIETVPIYLHINSNGGNIFEAFNAIDVIIACKVPIYTIIEGSVASAGTLISVVGQKRYICPHAYMLIHQLSSCCWGKMTEIEDEFKNLQELMDKIKDIYKENSSIPKKELLELLKHDLWLNAEKSLQYKLVDEIWNK
jgi:ATP-dependent Clp endopeptidase proteolytic subunit ClpP